MAGDRGLDARRRRARGMAGAERHYDVFLRRGVRLPRRLPRRREQLPRRAAAAAFVHLLPAVAVGGEPRVEPDRATGPAAVPPAEPRVRRAQRVAPAPAAAAARPRSFRTRRGDGVLRDLESPPDDDRLRGHVQHTPAAVRDAVDVPRVLPVARAAALDRLRGDAVLRGVPRVLQGLRGGCGLAAALPGVGAGRGRVADDAAVRDPARGGDRRVRGHPRVGGASAGKRRVRAAHRRTRVREEDGPGGDDARERVAVRDRGADRGTRSDAPRVGRRLARGTLCRGSDAPRVPRIRDCFFVASAPTPARVLRRVGRAVLRADAAGAQRAALLPQRPRRGGRRAPRCIGGVAATQHRRARRARAQRGSEPAVDALHVVRAVRGTAATGAVPQCGGGEPGVHHG